MTNKTFKMLLGCLLVCCIVCCGCRQPQTKEYKGITVILENGPFPKELVGVWKDLENWGWSIEFTKDGRIVEITHPIGGYIPMKPGEITELPMKREGISRYVPGVWNVKYDLQKRYLDLEIKVDDFFAEIGDTTLAGNGRDLIYGPFTEDLKIWKAEWVAFRDLLAITEEFPEGTRLPVEAEDTWVYITFVKVDPNQEIERNPVN